MEREGVSLRDFYMAIQKFIYPLDLSGKLVSNRVEETHVIGVNQYRAFALRNGAFFTDELVVREVNSLKPLKRGDDYECVFYFDKVSKMTAGKEVAGVIVISNPSVSTDIIVNANIVGGPYASNAELIEQAIIDLELDNRNIYWKDILLKPDLWQPASHLHDIGDVFGFEFIISILSQIKDVLLIGDNAVMLQLRKRIDAFERQFTESLALHTEDKNNPHDVTAEQTNAYDKETIDALLSDINKAITDLDPRFKVITDNITKIFGDIDSIRANLSSVTSDVGLLSTEQARFLQLLADVNSEVEAFNAALAQLKNRVEALEQNDIVINNAINALTSRMLAVETKNSDQDKAIAKNASDLENYKVSNDNKVNSLSEKVNDLEDEHSTFAKKTQVESDIENAIIAHKNETDPHSQYVTHSEANSIASSKVNAHANASDPHSQYTTSSEATSIADSRANSKINSHRTQSGAHDASKISISGTGVSGSNVKSQIIALKNLIGAGGGDWETVWGGNSDSVSNNWGSGLFLVHAYGSHNNDFASFLLSVNADSSLSYYVERATHAQYDNYKGHKTVEYYGKGHSITSFRNRFKIQVTRANGDWKMSHIFKLNGSEELGRLSGHIGNGGGSSGGGTGGGGTGGGGGCLECNTPIRLANGDIKPIKQLKVGDELMSYDIPSVIDERHDGWENWSADDISGSKKASSKVVSVVNDWYKNHYVLNGNIKVTVEHHFLVKRDGLWIWSMTGELQVGDLFLAEDESLIELVNIEFVPERIDVVTIDVESIDNYFGGNIDGKAIVIHNLTTIAANEVKN